MVWVITFDLLYPKHEFAALIVSPPNMIIPTKITGNTAIIVFFSLPVFLNIFEYQNSPNGNYTAVPLFGWYI